MILGSLLILGAAGSAAAADGLSYNLLEGGYSYTDIKGTSGHGNTLWVGGSHALGSNLYGFGNLASLDYSGGGNAKYLNLGVGYHGAISSAVDFTSGLSIEFVDYKGGGSDTGAGLSVGLRGKASDSLELMGGVKYVDWGGSDGIEFSVGSRYYFTPAFAAGLDLSMDDDSDTTTIGITFRYDFGM
ncbi:MAG: hypothetical protein ABIQ86_12620 [Steroidobacteraceae bacterium]